jgi:hypothetical protein
MKKMCSRLAVILMLVTTLGTILMSTGCAKTGTTPATTLTAATTATSNTEGFAIYLTKDNIPADQMPALAQIQIADTPLIAMSDIISYDDLTCRLTLNGDASRRITDYGVPTIGLSFAACVNRQPVYWGVFWSAASSAIAPSSCVIANYPLQQTFHMGTGQNSQQGPDILELAYAGNNDPRNSPAIIAALQQAGKINHEGFAIYLPPGDVSPQNMPDLNSVELPTSPFIGLNDIVSFNPENYQLTLTPDAVNRIIALQIGVYGKSFVVCVDRLPVYWGAFWTPISSVPFDGIAIEQPLNNQTDTVTIQTGYPTSSFFTGTDRVDDAAIQESFRQVGKLISPSDIPLPQSPKGYELYSWLQDDQWNYTLITGTNREKTTQEIVTGVYGVNTDGLVNIHAIGLNAIEQVISLLPAGEFVTWLSGPRSDDPQYAVNFALPPANDVAAIKTYADQHSLNLNVFFPGS